MARKREGKGGPLSQPSVLSSRVKGLNLSKNRNKLKEQPIWSQARFGRTAESRREINLAGKERGGRPNQDLQKGRSLVLVWIKTSGEWKQGGGEPRKTSKLSVGRRKKSSACVVT